MSINSKSSIRNFKSKQVLSFAALLLSVVLFFSCFTGFFSQVSLFVTGASDKRVGSEAELLDAVSAAPDGASYVIGLSKDITLKYSLIIPEGKNITLVSVGGFWKLVGAHMETTIIVRGSLTIDGIIVTHVKGDHGMGVSVGYGGTLILCNGEISGNRFYRGGGVGTNGVFVMLGGKISDNTALSGYGGGVYINSNGVFEVLGGEISGNTATKGGGVCNLGSFVMDGGVISGNNVTNLGGGVCNDGNSTMVGGVISDNSASSGGGIYIGNGEVRLLGGKVFGNIAEQGNDIHNENGNLVLSEDTSIDEATLKDMDIYVLIVAVAVTICVVIGWLIYFRKKIKPLTKEKQNLNNTQKKTVHNGDYLNEC